MPGVPQLGLTNVPELLWGQLCHPQSTGSTRLCPGAAAASAGHRAGDPAAKPSWNEFIFVEIISLSE